MIEAQLIIIIAAIFSIVYLIFMLKKKDIMLELFIAALISALWVTLSNIYEYSMVNYDFFGFNIFPWICWTAGLVILKEIYEWMNFKGKFIVIVILYWALLLGIEYVGYNWLNIQLASNYSGLFGLELMHMPWWGQMYYLAIAPVYVLITNYLEVE